MTGYSHITRAVIILALIALGGIFLIIKGIKKDILLDIDHQPYFSRWLYIIIGLLLVLPVVLFICFLYMNHIWVFNR